MTTQEIQKLQDSLVKLGYMTQAQVNTGYGTYGPKTTAAYNAYQADIEKAAKNNVTLAPVVGTQSYSDFMNANGGNIGNATNPVTGMPFSAADRNAALSEAEQALAPGFEAEKTKDTLDTESLFKSKLAGRENFLANQGELFQADKANQDQTSANQGVLFSGGRAQRLQKLQDTYNRNADYNAATTGADIANTARDFEYKYGGDAAKGLSQYYSLPTQSYNASVPTGGVSRGGLSSIYSPGQSNFQGTAVNTNKANANVRAAGLLWNKANKLVSGGYKNQY